jgi:predicted glutamine amidotransferase
MCGIFGVISRTSRGLDRPDMSIIKQMMLDTIQRGENSSGLFMTDYVDPNKAPTGVKVLGGPHNIYANEPLWREIEDYVAKKAGCFIGHGRYATRGKVNAGNAHPFQHEHITMVHNGTIHSGVSYKKTGDALPDVDSHALAISMAEHGVLEALARVRGAYAVVVHDSKEGCLYVARNDDRPLHAYATKDRYYIMSEGDFLRTIMKRYDKWEKDNEVMFFKPEVLVKIDLLEPNDYQVVGNIKERREAIEEEERRERVKEAEERAKKYPVQRFQTPTRVADTKERHTLEKKLREVTFLVQRVEPFGTNFKFFGITSYQSPVTFISDQKHEEYIERVGRAKIHSYFKLQDKEGMFVRHRDITWVTTENLTATTVEEAPAEAGNFRTYNGKSIPKHAWYQRVIHEGCNTCDINFGTGDCANAVLTDDDMLLCLSCAAEFSVGQVPKGVS